MLFLDNKYTRWYFQIVTAAKNRSASINYSERHHIIPKSLGGGNTRDNLVDLTAREHFVCHLLLRKTFSDKPAIQKMKYAAWQIMNCKNKHTGLRYAPSSRIYEVLKIDVASANSERLTGKTLPLEHRSKISKTRRERIASGEIVVNENKEKYKLMSDRLKGRSLSDDTKRKIGAAHKGKVISDDQRQKLSKMMTGKNWSDQAKERLSNTMREAYASGERVPVKGMLGKTMSDEAKMKISQGNRGKTRSAETIAKMSEVNKGKTWKLVDGKRVWMDRI